MLSSRKLKALVVGLLALNLFLSNAGYVFAQNPPAPTPAPVNTANKPGGAGESIQKLICSPTEPGQGSSGSDLYACINNGYKLIIVLGSLGAVFWVIVAGYLYMASDGSQESITKAKEILVSTVAGIFIILMTFVFLRQINPEIVNFPAIDLQTITNTSGLLSPYEECYVRNKQLGKTDEQAKEACKGLSTVVGGGSTGGQTITGTGGKVCSLGDNVAGVKVKCDIPAAWKQAINEAASANGLPANFIKAVITKESTWKPDAVGYNGSYYGLMQVGQAAVTDVKNSGSSACNGDWKTDPIINIKCGSAYFKVIRDRYKAKTNDDILAAYNWGIGHLGPSNICTSPQLKEWQCPFTDKSQTACHTDGTKQPKQVQDYVVTINRLVNDYQKCGN